MTIALEIWAVAGAIALAGAVVGLARGLGKKRREAYEAYCLTRGYTFERERPRAERRYEDVFDLFRAGRSKKWGYTITGKRNGFPFTAFEYRWVTGSGNSSSHHRMHAIVWEAAEPSLPKFALTPEGVLARLGELFGMQDIDFPESPEFSRAYRLKGKDEAAIRDLFTSETRAFFAATPDQKVAGGGHALFWWHAGRLPKPEQLDEYLEEGDRLRRRLFKE